MTPVIDFSDVKGPEPIPDGEYLLTITKAEFGESNSGAPKIDVTYEVTDGEYQGRKVFDTISFHKNALMFTKVTLQQLGADVTGKVDPEALAEEMLGLSLSAFVKIQESDQVDPRTQEPYPARNRISRILQTF